MLTMGKNKEKRETKTENACVTPNLRLTSNFETIASLFPQFFKSSPQPRYPHYLEMLYTQNHPVLDGQLNSIVVILLNNHKRLIPKLVFNPDCTKVFITQQANNL